MSVNPKNPKNSKTIALGETRDLDGNLEWFDGDTKTWKPAVRQHTIRDRLLQDAAAVGSYSHPGRGAGEGNNVTAPLLSDLADDEAFIHRPARLFLLDPPANQYDVQPTTVMMDGGKIMLDPYDHPIRDFGLHLPIVLSTQMKGWEIENYMRKNTRCPKTYTIKGKTHSKPPTVNAVRDRATVYRTNAGLLSWGTWNQDNANIRAYIMGLLPAGATTTRGLNIGTVHEGGLTTQQVLDRKYANTGLTKEQRKKT